MKRKIPNKLNLPSLNRPNAADFAREVAKDIESSRPQSESPGTKTVEVIPEDLAKALLVMATNAWRMRVKLSDPRTGEPREEIGKDELKKVNRYVQAIFESLSSIGMEVKDRTGEAFDCGLPEKFVASEPRPELTKDTIIETLRPTIYWGSQIAQQGEVVIGTPFQTSETKEV